MWPSGGLLKGVSRTDSPSVLSLYVFTKSPKQEHFSDCSKKWPFTERGCVGGLARGEREETQNQQEAQLDFSPLPLCKSSMKSGWFWCMCFKGTKIYSKVSLHLWGSVMRWKRLGNVGMGNIENLMKHHVSTG